MNKRVLIVLLLVVSSLAIFIYQFKYSKSTKISENLKDFSKMESFLSSEVDEKDLNKIGRKENDYSFTVVNKEDVHNFQKLGNVSMVDKNSDLINSFILFKDNEKYLVYMRKIYMIID